MTLPSPSDYSEAIQSPALAFDDHDLKTGFADVNVMGLPKPISGNFATVFRITARSGTVWAVKCFTRPVPDQRRRYEAISTAINQLHAPTLVGFKFLPLGIRVNGAQHPIVKMEWTRGDLLGNWIETNRFDAVRLLKVGSSLLTAVQGLEQAGISHGDLQHGNVLVDETDSVRLIDYDGMYVPALDGMKAAEVGHRHYQHPQREQSGFGPHADRFAASSIWLSLIALAADPYLWDRYGDSREHLLFTAEDYLRPDASALIRELQIVAPEVGIMALDVLTTPLAALQLPATPNVVPSVEAAGGTTPRWLTSPPQVLPPTPATPVWLHSVDDVPAAPTPVVSQDWMASHLPPLPSHRFENLSRARRLIASALSFMGISFVVAMSGALVLGLLTAAIVLLAALAVLRMTYRRDPTVQQRTTKLAASKAARSEHERVLSALQEAQRQRAQIDQRERTEMQQLYTRLQQARHQVGEQRREIETRLQSALADIARRVRDIQEQAARREQEELSALASQSVQSALAAANITARACDIPAESVRQLAQNGIRTAADFTDYRHTSSSYASGRIELKRANGTYVYVYSVGPHRASVLKDWRRRVVARAEAAAPRQLPPAQSERLRAERDLATSRLQSERANREHAAQHERNLPVAAENESSRTQLDIVNAQARFATERSAADQQIAILSVDARDKHAAEQRADRELRAFADATMSRYLKAAMARSRVKAAA